MAQMSVPPSRVLWHQGTHGRKLQRVKLFQATRLQAPGLPQPLMAARVRLSKATHGCKLRRFRLFQATCLQVPGCPQGSPKPHVHVGKSMPNRMSSPLTSTDPVT
eukprot:1143869-Pelagomonas_calceolata.AAC.5